MPDKDQPPQVVEIKGFQSYMKQVNRVNASISNMIKSQQKYVQGEGRIQKSLAATEKSVAKAVAGYTRMGKAQEKLMAAQQKLINQLAKTSKGFSLGFGLPAFLSAAAISAAGVKMSEYVTHLARARDMAESIGGGRALGLQSTRDYELFAAVGQQQYQARFLGGEALQGMTRLRDQLARALRPEAARDLSEKLIGTFAGESRDRLRQFLTLAGTDTRQALMDFMSPSNAETFSTALGAINNKMDQMSKTAFTLERGWQRIKDTFEQYVISIVGGNGEKIDQVLQQAADGVVGLINSVRQWGTDFGAVFDYILAGFRQLDKAWDFWQAPLSGGKRGAQVAELTTEMEMYNRLSAKAVAAGDSAKAAQYSTKAQEIYSRALAILNGPAIDPIKPIQFGTAVDNAGKSMRDLQEKSKAETEQIERMLTPAEKMKLVLDDMGKAQRIYDAMVGLAEAKLRQAETSLFGWSDTLNAKVHLYHEIGTAVENISQQIRQLRSLEQLSNYDREKLLGLEIKRAEMLARQNMLVREQARGYLDALHAQAFMAGRFSKIIVTQDTGILRALRTGMALENPLLGKAGFSPLAPFQLTGNVPADLSRYAKRAEEVSKYMGNPLLNQSIMPNRDFAMQHLQMRAQSVVIEGAAVSEAQPRVAPTRARVTGDQELDALNQIRAGADTLIRIKTADKGKPYERQSYQTNLRFPD